MTNFPQWTTRTGEEIDIHDMPLGHLSRTVAMLERNGWVGESDVMAYLLCEPSGEAANEAFMAEFEVVLSKRIHPLLDPLRAELKRRSLRESTDSRE